ncbi:DUF2607 family protein [Vibrio injensis]|uniref:DUF2607 family protein n=1 Tax=Vibrio injensis TaxID=1307414 RepID=UPI000932701C|nr:DUF2607 family protein [Vibrio injensis]EKO3876980.1 DUF2607 family protein [Vibrio metschnikovii]
MMVKPQPLRLSINTVSILAVLLVLWLNIAVINHQLDIHPTQHTDHHCQLFSVVKHGLEYTTLIIPIWPAQGFMPVIVSPFCLILDYITYVARSPPKR